MATSQGYKCEFIEFVPEDFYCKKCTLVASRLVYTSCCEETFCYTSIVDSNQDKPCPVCGKEEFPWWSLKIKVEQHVAQECAKRPHICQHCGFKATYKEIVDTHLPECK